MHTPALAIVYAQWCRHWASLIAALVTLLVTALISPFTFSQFRAESIGVPIAISSLAVFAVFALTINSLLFVDEAGNFSSSYPAAMLTLPVRSHTLAIAPIVLGSVAAPLLWIASAILVYWPLGFHPPLFLTALGFAALMACLNSVAWMPLARGWVRDVLKLVILIALATVPTYVVFVVENSTMLISTLLSAYVLAALGVGCLAVASVRGGEVWPLWPSVRPKAPAAGRAQPIRRLRPLASSAKAQFWYEWNCHGWGAPAYVGIIFFLIIGLLVWRGALAGSLLFGWIFALVMSLPMVMTGAIGTTLGRLVPFWIKDRGAITFLATRPVSSGSLAAAKFQMALVSSIVTCAFVIIGTAFWIIVSGNLENARDLMRTLSTRFTDKELATIVLAIAVLLPAVTWKQLSDSFAVALTGRRWIIETTVCAGVAVIVGLGYGAFWLFGHQESLSRFYTAAPWLAAGLAILKSSVAIGAFTANLRWGLLSWWSVGKIVIIWLGLSAVGIGLALLVVPAGGMEVSRLVICITLAAFMPLCRFPLATLALDWNRHR
jgi:hypothetical protein